MQLPTHLETAAPIPPPKRSFLTTFLVAVFVLLGVVCLLQSGDTSFLRAQATGYAAGVAAPHASAPAVSAAFPLAAFETPRAVMPAMQVSTVDVSTLSQKAAAAADMLPLLALSPGFVAAARSGKVTMSDTPAHRQPATGGAPQSTGDAEADEAHAKLLAHLRAPIRQYDGGWADTVSRDGKKIADKNGDDKAYGTGGGGRLEDKDFTLESKTRDSAPVAGAAGSAFGSTGSDASNFGRLSDKLKAADVEKRKEEEEIYKREHAIQLKREERLRKIAVLKEVPDDLKVGTVGDFMYKEGVREILEKLDYDLIGLVPVKERVREIASLLVVDKMRMKMGLETSVPSLHMGFTGAPGTGKTTVALRMGQVLQKMGYCRTGHVVVATRDDLVGQYVGHTAPKTKEMVKKAMGGILLVDEAYYLYNAANDRDYGQESIEILLNVMENNKEDIVVVLAGYKDRMDKFYGFIPGMNSRIGNHIEFPDYGPDELVEIAKVMARELEYTMDDAAVAAFKAYITKRMELPFFSNARTVRNVVDLGRMQAAVRLFETKTRDGSDGVVTEAELKTIQAEDFPSVAELEEEQRRRQALCDAAER